MARVDPGSARATVHRRHRIRPCWTTSQAVRVARSRRVRQRRSSRCARRRGWATSRRPPGVAPHRRPTPPCRPGDRAAVSMLTPGMSTVRLRRGAPARTITHVRHGSWTIGGHEMYTMSPEDRLRLVVHQKNELREGMALERTARAASASRRTPRSGARERAGAPLHLLWASAQRLVHAITGRPAVAPHGATR